MTTSSLTRPIRNSGLTKGGLRSHLGRRYVRHMCFTCAATSHAAVCCTSSLEGPVSVCESQRGDAERTLLSVRSRIVPRRGKGVSDTDRRSWPNRGAPHSPSGDRKRGSHIHIPTKEPLSHKIHIGPKIPLNFSPLALSPGPFKPYPLYYQNPGVDCTLTPACPNLP